MDCKDEHQHYVTLNDPEKMTFFHWMIFP